MVKIANRSHDRQTDRNGKMRKGQAGWYQDQEDFLRGIGHRGQCVGGKDGQSKAFGEPFVCGLSGLEGIADEPTLEKHGKDYRTNRRGASGEEARRFRAKASRAAKIGGLS